MKYAKASAIYNNIIFMYMSPGSDLLPTAIPLYIPHAVNQQ